MSPSSFAEYLEIGNVVLGILIAKLKDNTKDSETVVSLLNWDPFLELVNLSKRCSGLDKVDYLAVVRRAVLISSLQNDPSSLGKIIGHLADTSEAALLAALETSSEVWESCTQSDLGLFNAYRRVFDSVDVGNLPINMPAVRAAGLACISKALQSVEFSQSNVYEDILGIYLIVNAGEMTPDLSTQRCSFTGHVLHATLLTSQNVQPKLVCLGDYLAGCLTEDKVSSMGCYLIHKDHANQRTVTGPTVRRCFCSQVFFWAGRIRKSNWGLVATTARNRYIRFLTRR